MTQQRKAKTWHQPKDLVTLRQCIPGCPKCGTRMKLRSARATGALFWGCPRWKKDGAGCSGSYGLSEWLAREATESVAQQFSRLMSYDNRAYGATTYKAPTQYAVPQPLKWVDLMWVPRTLEQELSYHM